MPIRTVCGGCKAKIKAPDSMEGKVVKCPRCGAAFIVHPVKDSLKLTPATLAQAPLPPPAPPPIAPQPTDRRTLCPYCREDIAESARKCRHCGEILDPLLRSVQEEYNRPAESNAAAAVLSFLLPGLGQLIKGQAVAAIGWFLIVLLGYFMLVIPGLILHLVCIIDAGSQKRRPRRY